MVAGIPVPSLITTILLGLANDDLTSRWLSWFGRQMIDPEVTTTDYCTYNQVDPTLFYFELYGRLLKHFTKHPVMLFIRCVVIDVKIDRLEDDTINVRYFVKYRHT